MDCKHVEVQTAPPEKLPCQNCKALQRSQDEMRKRVQDLESQMAEQQKRIKNLEEACAKLRGLAEALKDKLAALGVDVSAFDKALLETGVDDLGIKPLRKVFERLWQDAIDRMSRLKLAQEAAKMEDLMGASLFRLNPEVVLAALKAASDALDGSSSLEAPTAAAAAAAAAIAALAARGHKISGGSAHAASSYNSDLFDGLQGSGQSGIDPGLGPRKGTNGADSIKSGDAAAGVPRPETQRRNHEVQAEVKSRQHQASAVGNVHKAAAMASQQASTAPWPDAATSMAQEAVAQRASAMRGGSTFEEFVKRTRQSQEQAQSPMPAAAEDKDDAARATSKSQLLSALLFGPAQQQLQQRTKLLPDGVHTVAPEEDLVDLSSAGVHQLSSSTGSSRPRSGGRPTTLEPLRSPDIGAEQQPSEPRASARPKMCRRPSSSGAHLEKAPDDGFADESKRCAASSSPHQDDLGVAWAGAPSASTSSETSGRGVSSLHRGGSKSLPQLGQSSNSIVSTPPTGAWRASSSSFDGKGQAGGRTSMPGNRSSRIASKAAAKLA